jgi:hypothetical protein
VVIWLNGAFGVGKTTVAKELVANLPGGRLTDPERIGFIIKRTFWRTADYQDVSTWRQLVKVQIAHAARSRNVVVPMTVVRPDVYSELTDGARVFLLVGSRNSVLSRIEQSNEAQQWRTDNLDRCLAAFERHALGERIETDGRTPAEVAALILERL